MKKKLADPKLTTVDPIITNPLIQEERKFFPAIDSDYSLSDESEQEPDALPAISVKKKQTKQSRKETSNERQQLLRQVQIDDISIEAKKVILTLTQCKKIVKYIKKMRPTDFLYSHSSMIFL